jgi:hypothetical protein
MTEPVIYREEVVRLLFATDDISETLHDILVVRKEEDGGEAEDES